MQQRDSMEPFQGLPCFVQLVMIAYQFNGIHLFDGGGAAFSIVIVGYDTYDSYAYLGGTGTGVINPNPQG
jgi:hypothetical protein